MLDSSGFSKQPIGVFDSGIGGLIALRKLSELLPHEEFLYLGDAARVPYGNRSTETIIEYSKACVRFLLDHSVKEILVACNTASSVALPALQALSPVPVTGVIDPPVQTILSKSYHRVGVIGTRATIESQAYENAIRDQGRDVDMVVYSKACPLFVPLVEEGWYAHPAAEMIVQDYLGDIVHADIQALILGCTHYAYLEMVIRKILPKVDLIDSGFEAAKWVAKGHQTTFSDENPSSRKIMCYMTDITPTYIRLTQQFLGSPTELKKTLLNL